MTAGFPPGAPTPDSGEDVAQYDAGCLRPFCCNPFAAFSAFSRVGGWTPPLPGANADQGAPGDA
ncbi:hypothetical protein [Paraburkholderia lycopersici]|uniref:Uncharacterized protein n=1 Tax=Paraburkholderia lycopersici TaxID=416944 RepID=A0A1G6QYK7_9BURK|nr:hypothetical protein [Paraburkholderia lycopersici]SDC97064.1 hypothetical protein SAMN05421548_112155 [Paraburkholderia lycopersici]